MSIQSPAVAGLFDDPKNLKVLPEDISSRDLRMTMMGFAMGTGSRCSSCHVGEVEEDLSTYNFSLDEKEKKQKARAMIRMVNDINNYLGQNLSDFTDNPITVTCVTCHRGRPKPEMIEDLLLRVYRSDGMDEALKQYRDLRHEYFGNFAFDFSPDALNSLAERMAGERDLDAALKFLAINLEFNPEAVRSYLLQAEVWKRKGELAEARKSYLKALDIAPDDDWARQQLEALDKPQD